MPFLWGESGTMLVVDEATCTGSEVICGTFDNEVSSGSRALAGCSVVSGSFIAGSTDLCGLFRSSRL